MIARIPTAQAVCDEHYTAPPKPSTCGKCPIVAACHSGGRSEDWMARVEAAAVALRARQ